MSRAGGFRVLQNELVGKKKRKNKNKTKDHLGRGILSTSGVSSKRKKNILPLDFTNRILTSVKEKLTIKEKLIISSLMLFFVTIHYMFILIISLSQCIPHCMYLLKQTPYSYLSVVVDGIAVKKISSKHI